VLSFHIDMSKFKSNKLCHHPSCCLQSPLTQHKLSVSCCVAEAQISKAGGGLAFEVILKPANTDNPPAIIASSPTKERSISQELIEKKLRDAEERRIVGDSIYIYSFLSTQFILKCHFLLLSFKELVQFIAPTNSHWSSWCNIWHQLCNILFLKLMQQ